MNQSPQKVDLPQPGTPRIDLPYLSHCHRRKPTACQTVVVLLAVVSLIAHKNQTASADDTTDAAAVRQVLSRAREHAREGNLEKAIAVCEEAQQAVPDDRELLLFLTQLSDARGRQLIRGGQQDQGYAFFIKAGETARRLRERHPQVSGTTRSFLATAEYNAACGYALSDQVTKAIQSLRGAIQSGFDDLELLVQDGDLETLRKNPDFLQLVRQLEQSPSVKARLHEQEARQLVRRAQYREAIAKLSEALSLARNLYDEVEHPKGHPRLADILNQLGVALKLNNEYDRAEEVLKQAFDMRRRLFPQQEFPRGHVDLATSLNDMASLFRARGDYPQAIDYFRRALEMKVRLYPAEQYPNGHVNIATAMANLAVTLDNAGRSTEAHQHYLQQLSMVQRIYAPPKYPDGHMRLVQALSAVGHSFRRRGQLHQAASYAHQSLEMAQRLFPESDHPEGHSLLAECLNDLGLVLHRQGEFAEAEKQFESSYAMFRRLYPGERGHSSLFYCLINLGDVARDRGDYVRAERWYEKAQEMQRGFYPRQRFPEGHPAMVETLSKLAGALKGQNRHVEAQSLHEQALEILRHYYPPENYPHGHPELARGLNNLAVALRAQGKDRQSMQLHHESLAMRRKLYPLEKFPQGHPDLASSLNNLGTLFLDQGDPAAALALYQEHFKMVEGFYPRENYPSGHLDLANALTNLGQTHQEIGDLAAARRFLAEALAMWRELYPEGHPDIPRTLDVLGTLLQQQGEPALARQHYEEAYRTRQGLFPEAEYPNGHIELTNSLSHLTDVMMELNNFPQSKKYADQMVTMTRRLFPAGEYPEGHLELALALSKTSDAYRHLGDFRYAQQLQLESLAIRKRLYPMQRYPRGHMMVARSLNNLALLFDAQGRHERARNYYEQSLAIRRELFPTDEYPDGHPDLARGLNNQGSFMESLGEFGAAARLHEEALAIRQRLYPSDKYPRGHRDLALSHHNLAIALHGRGRLDEAESHLRRALEMLPPLFPPSEYENGHPRLARSLNSLGSIMRAKGEFLQAREYFEQALEMRRQLYSEGGKTFDHPRVSESLNNVANVCADLGDFDTAEALQRESVEMDRRLYPPDDYPIGHPSLAAGIGNLGSLYVELGQPARGVSLQLEAVDMQYRLALAHVGGASEAESLNFVARHLAMPHGLLSAWDRVKRPDAELYRPIWLRKGMVHRVMAARNRALQAVRAAEEDELYERYLAARRGLARLVLSPGSPDVKKLQDHRNSMRALTSEKEHFERQLAERIPRFVEILAARDSSPDQLTERLPSRTVFIDMVVYLDTVHDRNEPGAEGVRRTWEIAAFVLARGKPIVRVPLGNANAVRQRVQDWRRAIAENAPEYEADELRRQIWEPLEQHIPDDTDTVVLCPDGALTAMPWAALPGGRRGSVLLEDYAIAYVPYGPFLLERLAHGGEANSGDSGNMGLLLAVGDVAYESQPSEAHGDLIVQRDATIADGMLQWPPLPGARQELDNVIAAARDRQTVRLVGDQASSARTIQLLPTAEVVHFATHGFFADKSFRSALQLDEQLFADSVSGDERSSVAGRSPLTLTGLVLAGANLPPQTDEFHSLRGGSGVLTGEMIAALPLDKLHLAVLSACETGIGEVAGGEGVFGLQRAFHIAGAHNVIGSLWKVDDGATVALMRLFYHKLWTENKTPLQSLRESQLALYHHPDQIGELSTSRGLNFDKVVKLVDDQLPAEERPETSPTKLWASFMLSGYGR